MKIAIIGGAGCIGWACVKNLTQAGHEVVVVDLPERINRVVPFPNGTVIKMGSILDFGFLCDALKGVSHVIHLAGFLGVRRTEDEKHRCLQVNISGTENVCLASALVGANHVIYASSSEVYGEPIDNSVSENSITQGKTVYAISKLAGEEMIKSFSHSFNYTICRFFNTYGPYQVAEFLIPAFISATKNNKDMIINGDGNQQRSYCYSSDTANCINLILNNNKSYNQVFNIGNSDSKASVLEIADLIIKLGEKRSYTPKKVFDLSFSDNDRKKTREIYHRLGSFSKAKTILGWDCNISLEEGIDKMFSEKILSQW